MSEEQVEMTDEEALMKLASAMKDNASSVEERQNVHTFLFNVASAKDTTKIGNLRVEGEIDELGVPRNSLRGIKELELISERIMSNKFFKNYFKKRAENILATSLSREGFLVRQGTTQTKQVADVTRRRKVNKGWFGKKTEEIQGGEQ